MYHVCPWPQGLGREGEREGGGMGERGLGSGEGGDFPLVINWPCEGNKYGKRWQCGHSCQLSRNGRDSPGILRFVPVPEMPE